MTRQEAAINSLKKSAREGRLVAVIGTGVSMALTNGKNPALSWKGLVADGFAYGVQKGKITPKQQEDWKVQLDSDDLDELLSAAEFMSTKLKAPKIDLYARWLEGVFKNVVPANEGMARAIRAIRDFGIPICTLNYDRLLEDVTALESITIDETTKASKWIGRDVRGILHLHGVWSSPKTCVLGIGDYNSTLTSEVRDLFQRNLGAFSHLLFIGCGDTFADPNFSALTKWLGDNMKAATPEHYALVTAEEEIRRHADASWQGFVEPVSYGANRDQLSDFLLELFTKRDLDDSLSETTVERAQSKGRRPIVLPYPSLGDLFKGRDKFLRGLSDSLQRRGHTAIFSHAFYGLGGIGKTRAAVEYAWAHRDIYSALLFVVAETPEALRRNLAALASTLVPELDTTDDAARLQAVLDWLKANPGWFLILDNVDAKPALAEVERILGALSGGHVVVTSRLADFSGNFQPLELGVLAIDDAAAFLSARTQGRRRAAADDDANARDVATELGQLALALEQAAAFIAKRRLTFAQYLEQWHTHRDETLAWFDETVTGYPRAVAVTWQTSIAQVSENGRHLLERLAWLAPEKVPEFLLDVPIPGAEGENLHEALDDLAAYSLVTRDAEGPFFLVHRLVQDVTRRSLSDERRQQRLVEALAWVEAAFTGDAMDVRSWPRIDPLAPHLRAISGYADSAGIFEPTAHLMGELGRFFQAKALHNEAELLMRRAVTINEEVFGPDHPEVARWLNNLSNLLQNINRLAEAEPLMRRVVSILEKMQAPNDYAIAVALNNLSTLLGVTNRLAEAEPLMRRALALNEKSFGPDDPRVAIQINNLAQLLENTNRLNEAEPLMRRALAIDEKSFGPNHPKVAIRINNLAQLLQDTDRFDEAEPLMRRALAIDEKSFGAYHPLVAGDLNNLAQLLQTTNRRGEVEPLMQRAIAIAEKSLGPDHPNVGTYLNNLALTLQGSGRLAEAEPLFRRALAIDEASFDPNHPSIALRLYNLARLLLKLSNQLVEAEPLMRRSLAILFEFERRNGHSHKHQKIVLQSYAALLEQIGRTPAEIEAEFRTLD